MKTFWYKNPAKDSSEAVPLGNGRIGATVFGGTGRETICLNEESVWSGRLTDRNNKNAAAALGGIRTLLNQSRETEAQEQVFECLTGCPAAQNSYRNAGFVSIDFYDAEHRGLSEPDSGIKDTFTSFDSYRRELDFSTGICTTSFSVESAAPSTADFSKGTAGSSITFTRECFVPSNSNVIVFHASASTPQSIFLRLKIESDGILKKYNLTEDTAVALSPSDIPYAIMATAVASGGTVFTRGDNLIVERADEVTIYIDVETAYRKRHFRNKGGNVYRNAMVYASKCADIALKKICFASGTSYENLKAEHIAEFSSWNHSGILSVDGADCEGKSFDELSADRKTAMLLEWHYSKYKLISGCKDPASVPKVRTGLWTMEKDGGNFSLQDSSLYRYCGEIFGFSKINLPLFRLAKRLFINGKETADRMYGCTGFTAHNSTDIWGDSAPCGSDFRTSYTPTGAVSVSRAVLDFYESTLDKKFLKKHLYIFREACDFFIEYLIPVEDKKFLILSPAFTEGYRTRTGSTAYIAAENTADNAQLRKLFQNTLTAMKYLGYKASDALFIKYSSALKKIKETEEVKADNGNCFDSSLLKTAESIIASRMNGGRVEITLLSDIPEEWPAGSLTHVCLKGNIIADIKWSNGKFENARLYTEPGTVFIKEITVLYEGKSYDSQLSDGSLDIRNVLPTTV